MHDLPDSKRRWSRRIVLSTGGVGVVGAGAMIYQAAPGFWQQYTSELRRPVHPSPKVPDPTKWPDKGMHAAWLGHSTVLMKIDGYTIYHRPRLQYARRSSPGAGYAGGEATGGTCARVYAICHRLISSCCRTRTWTISTSRRCADWSTAPPLS